MRIVDHTKQHAGSPSGVLVARMVRETMTSRHRVEEAGKVKSSGNDAFKQQEYGPALNKYKIALEFLEGIADASGSGKVEAIEATPSSTLNSTPAVVPFGTSAAATPGAASGAAATNA